MQKKKEKQHAERRKSSVAHMHADRPNHVRVRVFDKIVMI
jgi:hypothetical protein